MRDIFHLSPDLDKRLLDPTDRQAQQEVSLVRWCIVYESFEMNFGTQHYGLSVWKSGFAGCLYRSRESRVRAGQRLAKFSSQVIDNSAKIGRRDVM